MKILVLAMMIAFFLSGLAVFSLGVQELRGRISRRHRFLRAVGTIEDLRIKYSSGPSRGRSRPMRMNFPIVSFRTREGKEVTFTSEIGDAGPVSRYERGGAIEILYDPAGEDAPMLASWSGVWLSSVMLMLAGSGFLFGTFLAYVAFWDRIVGG